MIGRPMPARVRDAYRAEMRAARTATADEARWRHLERAHILSQPWPWPHTANHIAMFALAVRQRDRREALGQVTRIIVAAPGSAPTATRVSAMAKRRDLPNAGRRPSTKPRNRWAGTTAS
ncbi:DUF3703 domain-containing protein [Nonomuraea angiospora]|uniref:DUF3703 domain-containing protein n=1 Tax=Nonomuraea angiospora TaxID=46172 RepID=UPI00341C63FA